MMKTYSRIALIAVLLVTTAGVASAAFTGPFYDTWVQLTSPDNNPSGNTLRVEGSLGSCNDSQVTYFQFDASEFQTVSGATLVVTAAGTAIQLESTPQLSLFGVTDFNPATLNGTNMPVTDELEPIQTLPVPPPVPPATSLVGTQFTFGGSNSGLKDYIQTQVGGTVTLALAFSGQCSAVSSAVTFYSQEYSTNVSYRPQLTIEGTKPTAVDLATTSAERVTWPMYAGLGALAVVLAAGLAISRRRTA